MSAMADLRKELADAAGSVEGLSAYDYAPGQINAPAVVILPFRVDFDITLDHGATYTFAAQALVSTGDLESANRELDALTAHDGALVAALDSVEGVQVQGVPGPYRIEVYGADNYLAADLLCEVYA